MLRETLSKSLGENVDAELAREIKTTILEFAEVCEKVQKDFPEYTLQVAMDTDFSE